MYKRGSSEKVYPNCIAMAVLPALKLEYDRYCENLHLVKYSQIPIKDLCMEGLIVGYFITVHSKAIMSGTGTSSGVINKPWEVLLKETGKLWLALCECNLHPIYITYRESGHVLLFINMYKPLDISAIARGSRLLMRNFPKETLSTNPLPLTYYPLVTRHFQRLNPHNYLPLIKIRT